jgi:molecular chaperone GrpE
MTERKWPPDDDPHGHGPASSAHTLPTVSDALPDPGDAADFGRAVATDRSSEDRTQLLAENAELKDRLLRALAEVENTRRRAERDLDNMRQYGITKFAGDILHVADNLERAIASIPDSVREREGALKTLVEGVGLTEKELLRVLEKHGITKLDPVGERFDPNLHEALFEVPDPTVPRGTVMKVLQPGYVIGSRALRPARVCIASGA